MTGRKRIKSPRVADQALIEVQAGELLDARPAWRVTGASVQGLSHLRLALPCQDAQVYRVLEDGTLLVALADGAGSAEFSQEGAQVAVAETLRAMEEALASHGQPVDVEGWQNLVLEAFESARALVLELAEKSGENPRAFASTLTGVVATADGLIAGQIGDGAVVVEDEAGQLLLATHLQRGEYANETHFLVEEDALDQVVIEIIDRPVLAIAVMSDGLLRLALKMPAQEPHAPFFQPLFRFASAMDDPEAAAAQLADFLASERVNARTDDDKSLVLAALRPGSRSRA